MNETRKPDCVMDFFHSSITPISEMNFHSVRYRINPTPITTASCCWKTQRKCIVTNSRWTNLIVVCVSDLVFLHLIQFFVSFCCSHWLWRSWWTVIIITCLMGIYVAMFSGQLHWSLMSVGSVWRDPLSQNMLCPAGRRNVRYRSRSLCQNALVVFLWI